MPNHKTRKPLNILFLDIEGVLCTNRVQFSKFKRGKLFDYDPVVVDFLDSICTKYLTQIVIISDQRKETPDLDWFRSKMTQSGGGMLADFLFSDCDMWKTTDSSMECKAFEIDDWFQEFKHKYGDRFFVKNYCIISKDDIGSVSMHDKHFVRVENKHDGMGTCEFRKVLNIMEGA